jgi:hypothetical protein
VAMRAARHRASLELQTCAIDPGNDQQDDSHCATKNTA